MRFWEKFLKILFKLAAQPKLKRVKPKLLEPVLAKASMMLDQEMISEIHTFILSKQTVNGGFKDRGGKTDLYYTLFGAFIAEAFGVTEVMEPLKIYVKEYVSQNNLAGVYRFCGAILYAKLIGTDSTTEKLRKQIVADLMRQNSNQPEYSVFLGMLALYYLEDFLTMQRLVNLYKKSFSLKALPCPVVAATAILLEMAGNKNKEATDIVRSFYRGNGGFAALHKAPSEDLLSTAVALYALHFLDADVRLIKPDCLIFVDELYDNGGFRSTSSDPHTDIEYTFYGLLALGSLS